MLSSTPDCSAIRSAVFSGECAICPLPFPFDFWPPCGCFSALYRRPRNIRVCCGVMLRRLFSATMDIDRFVPGAFRSAQVADSVDLLSVPAAPAGSRADFVPIWRPGWVGRWVIHRGCHRLQSLGHSIGFGCESKSRGVARRLLRNAKRGSVSRNAGRLACFVASFTAITCGTFSTSVFCLSWRSLAMRFLPFLRLPCVLLFHPASDHRPLRLLHVAPWATGR